MSTPTDDHIRAIVREELAHRNSQLAAAVRARIDKLLKQEFEKLSCISEGARK